MELVVVPLDDRPTSVQLPRMVAAIARARVTLPPDEVLGHYREPGDHDGLAAWLATDVQAADAFVIAVDQLVHGGLVPARLSTTPVDVAIGRLEPLRALRAARPASGIAAYATVMRWPDADDATEEPDEWAVFGRRLHQLGAALHRVEEGAPSSVVTDARSGVPDALAVSMIRRRLRNHLVNLAAVEIAVADDLTPFVTCVDDTSPYSLSSLERVELASWITRLDRRDMPVHTGLDEVDALLTARHVLAGRGLVPRIAVEYVPADGGERRAPYEDGLVKDDVESATRLVGGRLVDADPDLTVVVHAPAPSGGDWAIGPPPAPSGEHVASVTDRVRQLQADGRAVAVADVAFPNGADPLLVEGLASEVSLPSLASFGGWNTAANTIGGVIAHAVLTLVPDHDRVAHERLLAHRFVDDWAFQAHARSHIRARLARGALTVDEAPTVTAALLDKDLAGLPGLGDDWSVCPVSVSLPWGTTFQVGFELEARP